MQEDLINQAVGGGAAPRNQADENQFAQIDAVIGRIVPEPVKQIYRWVSPIIKYYLVFMFVANRLCMIAADYTYTWRTNTVDNTIDSIEETNSFENTTSYEETIRFFQFILNVHLIALMLGDLLETPNKYAIAYGSTIIMAFAYVACEQYLEAQR